jgi:hypothetical protein
MLSIVVLCLSSHYLFVLLLHYEPVPPLDMSKPSQTMLHELLFDWCQPQSLAYVIVPDPISSCVAINPSQHAHHSSFSCWTCHLLVGQYSAPYNMAGRIVVLYNLPFILSDILWLHMTPES